MYRSKHEKRAATAFKGSGTFTTNQRRVGAACASLKCGLVDEFLGGSWEVRLVLMDAVMVAEILESDLLLYSARF